MSCQCSTEYAEIRDAILAGNVEKARLADAAEANVVQQERIADALEASNAAALENELINAILNGIIINQTTWRDLIASSGTRGFTISEAVHELVGRIKADF